MCRLRELLPYFDGYKCLRRGPCNNLQRLRRLTFQLLFHYFLMGVPVLLPAAAAVCVSACFSCRSRYVVTTVNRSSATQMKQKDLRQGERRGDQHQMHGRADARLLLLY